ncbi:3,4-dihydroxy-2-butanone 4-phosphate synthase [Klebsiella pneumoniae]|uniref:3,4-dihydroxy-2-butanone 4-phosphate synthase n=1 Tax=Klebsiella pneumoniae TaxID=573 RepID=A0A377VXI4_KLEPN|nr:3,4-dihydroxy-2-butanone 4-phosphate synthase [Klebsiella pneumoniae]
MTMAPWPARPECIKFAQQHNMAVVTIEDLVAYRREHERKAS